MQDDDFARDLAVLDQELADRETATDRDKAALMLRMVGSLDLSSADGRAGIGSLLRELASIDPEAIQRLNAELELRKLGISRVQ